MAEGHVIYSEKPNAFSMFVEAIFTFWVNFYSFSIGFIRYFHRLFRKPKNCETLLELTLFAES